MSTISKTTSPPNAPTISVIIPAYNAEATIARTLRSVLAQTLAAHEIIVVDDESRDATAKIVREFGERVRLVTQSNTGPGGARNRGIALATGEWLAFLDADDAWRECKLARQAALLTSENDLVHSYASTHSEQMKEVEVVNFDSLWKQNAFFTSSVVVRMSIVEEVGGFSEDRRLIGVEDYNLWLRLAARGLRTACVAEILVDYTPAENNLSSRLEHILSAELENVEQLRTLPQLSADAVRQKQAALYDEYAMNLLRSGDMLAARRCFRRGLRNGRTSRLALGWMATFLPKPVLEFKRWAKGLAGWRLSKQQTALSHHSQ